MASGKIVKHGASYELLWTNSSPTASFAAQTVSLTLGGYTAVFIVFASDNDIDHLGSQMVLRQGNHKHVLLGVVPGSNTIHTRYAKFSTSGVVFEGGYSGTTADNNSCIPWEIYGVKALGKAS